MANHIPSLLAGVNDDGYVYITHNFDAVTPTWMRYPIRGMSGYVLDFVPDPFSPLYLGIGSAVNGWLVTEREIGHLADIFGPVPTYTVQHTFANIVTAYDGQRVIETERSTRNFVVCSSYYPGGGVKVIVTTDGVNWGSETTLTSYATDVYLSPGVAVSGKTPSVAYTTAKNVAGNFQGYKYSAGSWEAINNPNISGTRLPGWIHFPWSSPTESVCYYGAVIPDNNAEKVYRAEGATQTDITPSTGGQDYTCRFPRSIDTPALNGNRVVLAGHNDPPGSTNYNAVFTSQNGGATWSVIYGPVETQTSDYLSVRCAGDDEDVFYLFGPGGHIAYSSDFGATPLKDKRGNLGDFTGIDRFVNICAASPSPTCQGPADCPFSYIAVGGEQSPYPISLLDGEKRERATDLGVVTPAGALDFTRAYRQNKLTDPNLHTMGLGWTHNHNFLLTQYPDTPQTIVVRMPRGGELHLTESSTNYYSGDPGSTASLVWDDTDNQYTLTTQDKSQYVFDTSGRLSTNQWQLTALIYPSGETWTYTYDTTSKQLTSVTDTYGKGLRFSYVNNPGQYDDGQLRHVGDQDATGLSGDNPTGRYVEFGYVEEKLNGSTTGTPNPLLATVRDIRGNVWTYDYYGQHIGESDAHQQNFLIQFRSPSVEALSGGGLTLLLKKLIYTLDGTTVTHIRQQRGDGLMTTDWAFQPGGQNLTTETTAEKTTIHRFANGVRVGMEDPAGNVVSQLHDDQFRPAARIDANGNQSTLSWSSDGKYLDQVSDALGNTTAFGYHIGGDSDGALDFSLDAQGRKTQYRYDDPQNPRLPTRVQVYDSDGATILHWQVFSYDSAGRSLTEQTFDPTSNGTQLLQQVDRSYYTSGNGNGMLKQVTQRDLQNPANDMTTMYFYDTAGRVIRTKQSLTFGNCTSAFTLYDEAGNVLASICNYDPGMDEDITTLAQALALYDLNHPEANRITSYAYDSLGRRISTTTNAGAPFAQTTLTVYDALDRVVRTITNYVPDPAIPDPYVHARADFSHGENNDQNLVTDTAYSERGLVRSQTDLLGNVTLFGYDDADRLVKTIQSASQPTYDNSYNYQSDPSLNRYLASDAPDQDIVTLNEHDAAGNLIRTTDALGNVTLTGYDALNRPVRVVRSASQPNYDLKADPTLSYYIASDAADQDVIDFTEYDAMGRVIRSRDTMGTWTLFGYDALGRQMKGIRSASQPDYDLASDPSLSRYDVSDAADQDLVSETAYDPAGRAMYTTDVLGRRTWTAYDGLNRAVKTVTNAVGTATDMGGRDPRSPFYNPVVSHSDQDVISRTAYDSNGYVLWAEDSLGRRTWTAYDSIGRPVKTISNAVGADTDEGARDPRSDHYIPSAEADQDVVTQTEYDAQGRVAATVGALGERTQFSYDTLGRRIKTVVNFVSGVFNPNFPDRDLVSTTVYDLAGRVVSTSDPRGTVTTFTYDRVGRRLTMTQAAGTPLATTHYTCYDKGGRVLRTIQNWKPGRHDASPDARDSRGNWLFNPAAHGRYNDRNLITVYTLDRLGRQTAISNPLGNGTTTRYDKSGQVEASSDPLGVVTKHRYDRARRRTRVVTSYQAGSFTDPTSWYWDDAIGHKKWKDGAGSAITFGAHNDQNVIVQVEYDKAGRMIALRDPRGNRTTYAYDQLDRRIGRTDPLGHAWITAYANLNGTVQTRLTDPLGQETVRETDQMGRLARLKYPDESPKLTPDVSIGYDKGGNRLRMSESDGAGTIRATEYGYDQARRLTSVGMDEDGDGDIEQTVSYQYDAGGLRTKLTLPGGLEVVYQYDARGQLIGLTDWNGQKTKFAYDGVGRQIGSERANGLRSRYEYDEGGRLRALRHRSRSKTQAQFVYEVDARGNRIQVQETQAHPATTADVTVGYNDPGIITQGTWTDVSGFQQSSEVRASLLVGFFGDAATLTMGVGSDHNRYDVYIDGSLWQSFDGYAASAGQTDIVVTLGINSRKLTHEGLHVLEIRNGSEPNPQSSGNKVRFKQLVIGDKGYDLHTIQYEYDALSRLLNAEYYPGLNVAATPTQSFSYGYDLAGNLVNLNGVTRTYNAANQLVNDGTNTLTYGANGNLTGDGINSYTWDRANRLLSMGGSSYAYDGAGNRISQTIGMDVTKYLLDLQPGLAQVIAATTGANTDRYVHAPRGIHAQQNNAGDWSWMMQDGLGSERSVADSSLAVLESRLYEPYGVPFGTSGTNQTMYGFTGEPTDANDLLYLRARYYAPSLGVFTGRDPFEGMAQRPMSLNGYSWVEGNVINRKDSTGLFTDPDDITKELSVEYSCHCGWIDWSHVQYSFAFDLLARFDEARWSINPLSNWGFLAEMRLGVPASIPVIGGDSVPFFSDIAVVPDPIVKSGYLPALALSVYMESQEEFEANQLSLRHPSGFSEEDLVSDLIGFYIGLQMYLTGRSFDQIRSEVEDLCDMFTRHDPSKAGDSLAVYQYTYGNGSILEGGVRSQHRSWYPRLLPLLDCAGQIDMSSSRQGNCNRQTRTFPSVLTDLINMRIPKAAPLQGIWWWLSEQMDLSGYTTLQKVQGRTDLYWVDYMPPMSLF